MSFCHCTVLIWCLPSNPFQAESYFVKTKISELFFSLSLSISRSSLINMRVKWYANEQRSGASWKGARLSNRRRGSRFPDESDCSRRSPIFGAQLEQREIIIHTKHKSGPLHVVSLIWKAAAPTKRLQRRRGICWGFWGLRTNISTRTRAKCAALVLRMTVMSGLMEFMAGLRNSLIMLSAGCSKKKPIHGLTLRSKMRCKMCHWQFHIIYM